MLGRRISHYEILDKLGAGGMGEVYKARDTRLNRLAALKVLAPDKIADADRRARFVQEAQAASALNHPHIVTIYGIDRDGDVDFIAMEYVAGRTLDQAIGRRGLKLADTLRLGVQIADALAAAHAAGIVHRDLKPGNVMVADNGSVKVLDFGLAKLTEVSESSAEGATRTIRADAPLTEKGTILGTISYMSPEQAEGKPVDARSDIFSFGSLLYEMVTGKRAFQGSTKMSTLAAILREEPKAASEVTGEATPRDLEKIIARCLRKDVARRFQHMDDVKVALEELKEESDSGRLAAGEITPRKARRSPLVVATLGVLLALVGVAAWMMRPRPGGSTVEPSLKLRQLTQDAGLTAYPAISSDGKLIAYASDRAGDGGLDIWVQQLSRGAKPIRLTKDPADERFPSFSPDGGQIVFTSQREGGGVYVIPSLGGEERLLMRGELANPRFSPDGQWVAAGAERHPSSKVFVVPAAGGAPRSLCDMFYNAFFLAWSPDGKKILIRASKQREPLDWWIVPLDGGPPAPTGARAVSSVAIPAVPTGVPNAARFVNDYSIDWVDDYVLYSDGNLWRIKLAADTGKLAGEPERLLAGSDNEVSPRAIAAGSGKAGAWRIVFASVRGSENLWTLPIDLNAARPSGEPRKLIADAVNRNSPSLSGDGARISYVSRGLEGYSVRTRDMATGAEKVLLQQSAEPRARISPDGNLVAYNPTSINDKETSIYLVPASGGESRKLCDTCGLIYDWSQDGKKILFRSGNPIQFSMVDVDNGQHRVILAHPKYHIHGVEFSPDGQWLAFHFAPAPETPRAIYLAPVRDGQAAGESEWIAIMDRPGSQTRPWWSPDGNILYFLSTAGGKMEVWAQRLRPATRRPVGEPFRIYSPPGERYFIRTGTWFGPGIGPRFLVFPVSETTGNLWIAE
jgi:eukaryotic-like serine/threonine-protein kinase